MKNITIGNGAFKDTNSFSMSALNQLETITIGDDCFKNIISIQFNSFTSLTTIKIGMNSFTKSVDDPEYYKDSVLQIYDCQKLTSIEIGRYSFSNYEKLTLSSLSLLENLTIGSIEQESNNFLTAPFSVGCKYYI